MGLLAFAAASIIVSFIFIACIIIVIVVHVITSLANPRKDKYGVYR